MSIKDYCKKYKVPKAKVYRALHDGHLHGTRFASGWNVANEKIKPERKLRFYVEYMSSIFDKEYSTYEGPTNYDDALFTCKQNNWKLETGCHGHDDGYVSLLINMY